MNRKHPLLSLAMFAGFFSSHLPLKAEVGIEWLTVGDPVNPADAGGYGQVSAAFRISKHEITNSQYAEFLNAHQSNTITPSDANYGGTAASTDVGSFAAAASAYGTRDQAGNVWEWNDAVIGGTNRGIRGGSWLDEAANLRSSSRGQASTSFESYAIGFRVAAIAP